MNARLECLQVLEVKAAIEDPIARLAEEPNRERIPIVDNAERESAPSIVEAAGRENIHKLVRMP